jgi:hypothetical protein
MRDDGFGFDCRQRADDVANLLANDNPRIRIVGVLGRGERRRGGHGSNDQNKSASHD